MKKLCAAFTTALFTAAAVSAMGGQDAPSSGKTYKIGIVKIVQHQALDDIEQGIMFLPGRFLIPKNALSASQFIFNKNRHPAAVLLYGGQRTV